MYKLKELSSYGGSKRHVCILCKFCTYKKPKLKIHYQTKKHQKNVFKYPEEFSQYPTFIYSRDIHLIINFQKLKKQFKIQNQKFKKPTKYIF